MDKQELAELAKEHLTQYVNECGCQSEKDVFQAIAVMLMVAASVKDAVITDGSQL